jgi:hypothetical protein
MNSNAVPVENIAKETCRILKTKQPLKKATKRQFNFVSLDHTIAVCIAYNATFFFQILYNN